MKKPIIVIISRMGVFPRYLKPENKSTKNFLFSWFEGSCKLTIILFKVKKVKKYEIPIIIKSPSKPTISTIGWKIEPPIIADTPNTIEYIEIPTAKNSFVTNLAIIDDREGISIASKIPVPTEIIMSTMGVILSV